MDRQLRDHPDSLPDPHPSAVAHIPMDLPNHDPSREQHLHPLHSRSDPVPRRPVSGEGMVV